MKPQKRSWNNIYILDLWCMIGTIDLVETMFGMQEATIHFLLNSNTVNLQTNEELFIIIIITIEEKHVLFINKSYSKLN